MICRKCGKEVPDGMLSCVYCGEDVDSRKRGKRSRTTSRERHADSWEDYGFDSLESDADRYKTSRGRKRRGSGLKPILAIMLIALMCGGGAFLGIRLLGERKPNPSGKVPAVTPSRTPAVTPSRTPAVTPSRTPAVTPSRTPAVTPSRTPAVTPSRTPAPTREALKQSVDPASPIVTFDQSARVNDNLFQANSVEDVKIAGAEISALGLKEAYIRYAGLTGEETEKALIDFLPMCTSISYTSDNPMNITITYYSGAEAANAYLSGRTDQLTGDEERIYAKGKRILAEIIRPGMTDLEKERAIVRYLADHVEYVVDNQKSTESAAGALLNGIAQCCGYTDAFYMLGVMAGLKVWCVSGTVYPKGEPHSWNVIQIDGKWYLLDVTWIDQGRENPYCMVYLNAPIGMMSASYVPDTPLPAGQYAVDFDANWEPWDHLVSAADYESLLEGMDENLEAYGEAYIFVPTGTNIESVINDYSAAGYRRRLLYYTYGTFGQYGDLYMFCKG